MESSRRQSELGGAPSPPPVGHVPSVSEATVVVEDTLDQELLSSLPPSPAGSDAEDNCDGKQVAVTDGGDDVEMADVSATDPTDDIRGLFSSK